MTIPLRQSTASQEIPLGYFLDSTNGNTEETGLTIANTDIKLWKMGATTLANKNSGGATHISNGIYYCVLDATDSNTLGSLIIFVHVAGALAVRVECEVMSANRYDSLVANSDKLQVDVVQIGDTTQSAIDLKDFADAGYNPATNKVTGVVLVDTVTTLTGHTAQTGDGYAIVNNVTYGLSAIETLVDELESRLTATRAGYLDNLSAGAVALASVCTEARLVELAAANLPADVSAILADTGTDGVLLAATATSAQLVDDIWDEIITGAFHNIVNSAARRLREIGAFAIESGTAQAGSASTITLAATANGTDGIFNRNLIVLVDNTGAGQTRTIVDYNSTTKVVVVDRDWRVSPDDTTEYQITPDDTPLTVDHGVVQAATATTVTIRDYASAVNDTYLCNIITIIAGTGRGQARLIGAYNGTTKVATICGDDWVTTPDTTSVYVMMPYGTTCVSCANDYALSQIAGGVLDKLTEDHQIAGSFSKAVTDSLADTNELQTDWVNGGRLDLILDIIAADTTTDIPALIAALNNISASDINTQMCDVMKTDTISEPAQGAPPATPTFEQAQAYLYFKLRNKTVTTDTEDSLYANDGTTKLIKAALTDDAEANEFTKAEYETGA